MALSNNDHRILRTEPTTTRVNDYGINKAVESLPAPCQRLSEITDNYRNVRQNILEPSSTAASSASLRNRPLPLRGGAFRA